MDAFGSPEDILTAPRDQVRRVQGFGEETTNILCGWEDHADITTEERRIAEFGASLVMKEDELYPETLRQIYDPPLLLYVWGELKPQDRQAIGVVGSRKCTHYGLQSAKKLSYQLASAGVTVLSGLARGIDTAAHEGAVASGGRTIAIIGSGLAKLYPPENQALAEKIASGHGAVVSEFPMDLPPDKQTFPMRNRIVSGWSSGILVVESPAWSGSLITANLAGDQGRSLYAVPGPIDRPTSAGCNKLIQQGARLVIDAQDILDDMGLLFPSHKASQPAGPVLPPNLSEGELCLLRIIDTSETQLDEIMDQSGQETPDVVANLMRLEIKGLIKQYPGRHYVRLVSI
jgi:DNA processing protein